MEEWGEEILAVRPAKFQYPLFSAFMLMFLVVGAISIFKFDGYQQLLGLVMTLVIFVITVRYYFIDRSQPVFNVFENGIYSKYYAWTGSPFIHFREVDSICLKAMVPVGAILVLIPYEPEKYFSKMSPFWRFASKEDNFKFHSPIRLSVRNTLRVDPTFLVNVCNEALANYRAKHGV